MKIKPGHVRAVSRLGIFLVIITFGIPALWISLRLKDDNKRTAIVRRMFVTMRWMLGVKVIAHGQPSKENPTLYVANHLSYLDIPILGSVLEASFVSRADVAKWPLFGYCAKLQRTIFTQRLRETAAAEAKEIRARLEASDRLLMFPEGTSSDGQRLLPFKAAFFAVAAPIKDKDGESEKQVTVQPISMVVTELGGLPIGRHQRPLYSWYGDMEFEPHFWEMLQQPSFTVEIDFHAPVTMASCGDRKKLAHHCETVIAEGISRTLGAQPEVTHAAHGAPATAA